MQFTFSGLESAVKRICETKDKEEGFVMMGEEERRDLARESMRLAFEHLAGRVGWALRDLGEKAEGVKTLVVSGGVASNGFLRHMYVLPSPPLLPSLPSLLPPFLQLHIYIFGSLSVLKILPSTDSAPSSPRGGIQISSSCSRLWDCVRITRR